jgi:hypothetical protein
MANVNMKFSLAQRDILPNDKPNLNTNALFDMHIVFMTKKVYISTLKLSEIRGLTGASPEYRLLEQTAVANIEDDGYVPDVSITVTTSKFVAWAKTQALQIINAIT